MIKFIGGVALTSFVSGFGVVAELPQASKPVSSCQAIANQLNAPVYVGAQSSDVCLAAGMQATYTVEHGSEQTFAAYYPEGWFGY